MSAEGLFSGDGSWPADVWVSLGIAPPPDAAERERLAELGTRAAAIVERQHQEAEELRRRIRP
jgi:hypothetical protein